MSISTTAMSAAKLAELISTSAEFADLTTAISQGGIYILETGEAVTTAIATTGGAPASVVGTGTALELAAQAQTAATGMEVATSGMTLLKTPTGLKLAGLGSIEVGACATMGGIVLGVAFGANMYQTNPRLWTTITNSLASFCTPGTAKIPVVLDIVRETGEYKALVKMGVIDAIKSALQRCGVLDEDGELIDQKGFLYNGEFYPGVLSLSNIRQYIGTITNVGITYNYYLEGRDVVLASSNLIYAYEEFVVYNFSNENAIIRIIRGDGTTAGNIPFQGNGITNYKQNRYENYTTFNEASEAELQKAEAYRRGEYTTRSEPGVTKWEGTTITEPEVYPFPIIIVPDPIYIPDPQTEPLTPIPLPAPDPVPLFPVPEPQPALPPYEPPEEWPEEEPWPETIPFPWPDPNPVPDPDWPTTIPWPLPYVPPEQWPTKPEVWPDTPEYPEPWPASPDDWPEEVPWPEIPETPEKPANWPEELPWPWPDSPDDWPEEFPWPVPWPDDWPEGEPWPTKWPDEIPYPDPWPYIKNDPAPDPTDKPDPYAPPTPDEVQPRIDPWPIPWPYPDPTEPTEPNRPEDDPTQPTPRPENPVEPIPPIPPPSPTGESPDPPVPIIPLPFTANTGLISVYHPTQQQLLDFASWLWVTWQDATIEKIWNNPFDGIITLFELYCTPTDVGSKTIRSGFLDSQITSAIISRYTTLDCGSITIPEYYGNYLDYAPYSKAYVYLPFIGVIELNADDIVGHAVNITYNIDEYNGSCIACITVAKVTEVNGQEVSYSNVFYQFSGNCAVELPIAGGSQAAIKAGMIEAAAWGIGSVVGGIMGGNSIGEIGQGLAYGAASAVHSITAAKSSVQHSGSFGSSYGAMGIKTPFITVVRPKQIEVPNYNELYGYQAHKAVNIGRCVGYLRCREVHVISPTASDKEKSLIEELLKTGVYVTE